MTRLPEWSQRLRAYMAATVGRPFAWGTHDCLMFAAGAVEAQTGVDPAARWRGKYRSQRGAEALLKRLGHADALAAVASHLPEIPQAWAHVGDLASVEVAGIIGVGVVMGPHVVVLRADGHGIVTLQPGGRAWRV